MANLIIMDGYMGSGKTFGMSLKALLWQKMSDCSIYSNYGLIGSKPFIAFEDFIKVAGEESSIITLDESHIDLSSRDFNTNSVKFFTNMIFYLRKMRGTLIMTSPLFDNIDSRVREVTNLYAHVSKDNDFMYYDWYDVQKQSFMYTEKVSLELTASIAPYIYDTYSMVTPLSYPDKREQYNLIFEQMKAENDLFLNLKGYQKFKPFSA
jgi:hypothetical protein